MKITLRGAIVEIDPSRLALCKDITVTEENKVMVVDRALAYLSSSMERYGIVVRAFVESDDVRLEPK